MQTLILLVGVADCSAETVTQCFFAQCLLLVHSMQNSLLFFASAIFFPMSSDRNEIMHNICEVLIFTGLLKIEFYNFEYLLWCGISNCFSELSKFHQNFNS